MVKDRVSKTNVSNNDKNNDLKNIYKILYESWRPRLYFDILPVETNPALLDVVIRNSGGSPAYNLKFRIEPDIYYYDRMSFAKLRIFRGIYILDRGQEIRFSYGVFAEVKKRGEAYGEKQTKVMIEYDDALKQRHTEEFYIDLERYEGLLKHEQRTINDIFKELEHIQRNLRSGILIKTPTDLQRERDAYMQSLGKMGKNI